MKWDIFKTINQLSERDRDRLVSYIFSLKEEKFKQEYRNRFKLSALSEIRNALKKEYLF